MFKLLLKKVRKQKSPDAVQPSPLYPYVEREEDDFVLIGESEIERSTTYPVQFKDDNNYTFYPYPPSPPQYQDIYKDSFSASEWYLRMGQKPSSQKIVRQTGDVSELSRNNSIISDHPQTSNEAENDVNESGGATSMPDTQTALFPLPHKSAVADVPFKLAEHLEIMHACSQQLLPGNELIHVDMQAYEYRFELERSILRDPNEPSG